MKSLILTSVLLLTRLASFSTALQVQFCHQRAIRRTDLCLAITTTLNATTGDPDLNLHLSAKLPNPGKGWVGFGVGLVMDQSLMFSMYGGKEEGTVTVSVRTTKGHLPPSEAPFHPEVHISKTWISSNITNALLTCYSCSSWSGTFLNTTSHKQRWIWATDSYQLIASDNTDLWLDQHQDYGHAVFDMVSSFSHDGSMPIVGEQRISNHAVDPHDQQQEETTLAAPIEEKHHKHSLFGLASIHGFLLAISFLVLSGGALLIRSGAEKGFKLHWVVQASAGGVIVFGCLLGIVLSVRHKSQFRSLHQVLGLLVLPSIIAQAVLGYLHHLQYKRTEKRSLYTSLHVWIGRFLMLVGNLNVGLGLRLAHAPQFKFVVWFVSLGVQLATLLPMWYFWSKGRTILDVLGNKQSSLNHEGYQSVDTGAFVIDEELYDENEDVELDQRSVMVESKNAARREDESK